MAALARDRRALPYRVSPAASLRPLPLGARPRAAGARRQRAHRALVRHLHGHPRFESRRGGAGSRRGGAARERDAPARAERDAGAARRRAHGRSRPHVAPHDGRDARGSLQWHHHGCQSGLVDLARVGGSGPDRPLVHGLRSSRRPPVYDVRSRSLGRRPHDRALPQSLSAQGRFVSLAFLDGCAQREVHPRGRA